MATSGHPCRRRAPGPLNAGLTTDTQRPWENTDLSPRERAEAFVAAMTLEQKIAQLHGNMETIDIYSLDPTSFDDENMFEVKRHVLGDDELGIPRMRITNGPVGVGMGDGKEAPAATSLPMTIGLAAGFDAELAREYGDIIGSRPRPTARTCWRARACACTACPPPGAPSSTSARTPTSPASWASR